VLAASSVEELVAMIRSYRAGSGLVEVWVSDRITMGGRPVPAEPTGMVAAVLTDAALAVGLWPVGARLADGGRVFRFQTNG
jgi:hypothetical protein